MLVEVSHKQLSTISQNVDARLSDFLSDTFKMSQVVSKTITNDGLYDSEKKSELESYLRDSYNDVKSYMPQLFLIKFSCDKSSSFLGFRKNDFQNLSLIKTDPQNKDNLNIYLGEKDNTPLITTMEHYDPKTRPWYKPAVKAGQTTWTEPYVDQDERKDISLSASTPIYKDNELMGVFSADVRIASFSNFLAEQKKLNNTSIFIFDQHKHLVAYSDTEHPTQANQASKYQQHPFNDRYIDNSADPLIKETANQIILQKVDLKDKHYFSFNLNNERYFSYTTPFTDENGLEWTIALTTPESTLLGALPEKQNNALWFSLAAGLIASFFGYLVFSRVTWTLRATAKAAQKISTGHWDIEDLPRNTHIAEINTLSNTFSDMTHKLKDSFNNLRDQLYYDTLTNLYTRQGLVETFNNLQTSKSGTIIAVGIERFRDINDTFGHHKGDKALLLISHYLKDLKEDDHILARSSGAEFILYIPTQKPKDIEALIERIEDRFKEPLKVGTKEILITPVMGIAPLNEKDDLRTHIKNASIALSRAKRSDEQAVYYHSDMAGESGKRMKTITEITHAIANDEFVPFYQPIVDVNTGEMIGVEALARWISPTKGMVSPLDFIPIAEEFGLIKQIGQQILRKACMDTQQAIMQGIWSENFHLHVNISVRQLDQDCFLEDVQTILAESGLAKKHLTLEITESGMADDNNLMMKNMNALQEQGISIAIDDFGTGYSSLSYLHKLPFNCLKIDRAFIRDLNDENATSSIAAIIMGMAKNMNVTVVSEGVETQDQAMILKDLGCQHAQGFLYSKPQPFEEYMKNAS
ncbi:MAG: EAL domain-containing protein [Vibrio sp.]